MKEMSLDEFRAYVNKNDENRVEGSGIADVFRDENSTFAVVCKKCGSMDIVIEGESGGMGSEYTGYMEGTNVIKCKSCGNAVSVDS